MRFFLFAIFFFFSTSSYSADPPPYNPYVGPQVCFEGTRTVSQCGYWVSFRSARVAVYIGYFVVFAVGSLATIFVVLRLLRRAGLYK